MPDESLSAYEVKLPVVCCRSWHLADLTLSPNVRLAPEADVPDTAVFDPERTDNSVRRGLPGDKLQPGPNGSCRHEPDYSILHDPG
jgi:hypothetical protein